MRDKGHSNKSSKGGTRSRGMQLCCPQAGDTQRDTVPELAVLTLARVLGRQAAREAFSVARAEASSSDATASPSPATTTDEE